MDNTIFIAILGSGALAALVSGVLSIVRDNLSGNKAIKNGLQQLMFDRIKHICKSAIKNNRMSLDDLQDLERMHTIYHDDLNGNGYLENLMQKVKALPQAEGK